MDKLEDHDIEYIAMSVLALIDKGKITGQLAKDLAKLCAVAYQNSAGVAYQGGWTAVEDGLPEESKYYIVAYEDLINYDETEPETMFFNSGVPCWDAHPEVKKIIAWREISKYQPDGGENK